MKKNDLAEIKKIDILSLQERIKKGKEEIAKLTLEKNTGKLANVKVIKNKKRNLAQMLTIARQKQLLKELEEKTNAK